MKGQHSRRPATSRVDELRDLLADAGDAELIEAQAVVAHLRAAHAGFPGDPLLTVARRRLHLCAALMDINARFRPLHGRDLKTHHDFASVRRLGDPSIRQFRDYFGSLANALAEAGLTGTPQAGAVIKRASRRRTITDADATAALAACIESLGGILPNQRQYENWRDAQPAGSVPSIKRATTRNGARIPLRHALKDAVSLIASHPELYPRAAAYLDVLSLSTGLKATA